MNRLKLFITSCSDGMETFLKTTLDIGQYPKRFSYILQFIQKLRDEFRQQLFEMQVVENQIKNSTEQMISTLDQQKQTSKNMLINSLNLESANVMSMNHIQKTLELTQHLKQDIETLETSSNALNSASQNSKQSVLEQLQHIDTIIEHINEIKTSSSHVSTSVESLGLSIQDIATILETVQNFYKQTQLLALNASIESARAGEAGKGFAVVAGEIRNLAEGSSSAVEKIVSIMKDINLSIESVKKTTHEESVTIQNAVVIASTIEEGLDSIKTSFESVDENLTLVDTLLEKNKNSIINMDASLNQTYNAYQDVEREISAIREDIDAQQQSTEKIEGLKDNLNDVSTSLNIITNKYQLNLLKENKNQLEQHAQLTIDKLQQLFKNNPALAGASTQEHKTVIDRLIANDETIEAAWTNTVKGQFIYSNPPAGIKNGNIRSWFQESIKGNNYISDFYISGISKGPCVTVSMPLQDASEKIIGVLGVDLRFN